MRRVVCLRKSHQSVDPQPSRVTRADHRQSAASALLRLLARVYTLWRSRNRDAKHVMGEG